MNLKQAQQKIVESSVIIAAPDQISSDLGGEAVVLNLKSGVYHGLNQVGARIWDLIQEPKQVEDIKQALQEEYEVEATQCLNDILGLLRDLQSVGLIEVRDEKVA